MLLKKKLMLFTSKPTVPVLFIGARVGAEAGEKKTGVGQKRTSSATLLLIIFVLFH